MHRKLRSYIGWIMQGAWLKLLLTVCHQTTSYAVMPRNKQKVDVNYEWLPQICTNCIVFGHRTDDCTLADMKRTVVPLKQANEDFPDTSTVLKVARFNGKQYKRKKKFWKAKLVAERRTVERDASADVMVNGYQNVPVHQATTVIEPILSNMPTTSATIHSNLNMMEPDNPQGNLEQSTCNDHPTHASTGDITDEFLDQTEVLDCVVRANPFSALVDEANDEQTLAFQGNRQQVKAKSTAVNFVANGVTPAVANAVAKAELSSPYMDVSLPVHVAANLQFKQYGTVQVSTIPSSTMEIIPVQQPVTTIIDETRSNYKKKDMKKKVKKDKGKVLRSNKDDNGIVSPMNSETDEDLEECTPSFITKAYAKASTSSSSEGARLSARQRKLIPKRRVRI